MPALSVLLPVRDAMPWLPAAMASLARQSFADFEIVAVDDGSADGSRAWLEQAAAREPRLRVLGARGRGLPAALNTALRAARAPLLARHDADDVSHRERFALQVATLREQPALGVLGSRVRLFPATATGAGMRRWAAWHNALLEHEDMRRELLIDSPLANGSALIRREVLERAGGWHERGWPEDLDLWIRLFESGVRFLKHPRALYGWRQHPRSATRNDPRYSRERFIELKIDMLGRGLLAGTGLATLIGVGESSRRWQVALGPRLRAVHEARRASRALLQACVPPIVLAYGAAAAREPWRAAATDTGLEELTQFIFVA